MSRPPSAQRRHSDESTQEEVEKTDLQETPKSTKRQTSSQKCKMKDKDRAAEDVKIVKALVDTLQNDETLALAQPHDNISMFCSSVECILRQIKDLYVLLMLQNEIKQSLFPGSSGSISLALPGTYGIEQPVLFLSMDGHSVFFVF